MSVFPYEIFILVIPFAASIWAILRKLAVKGYVEASILFLITVFLMGDGIAAVMQLHEDVMEVPRWIDLMQLYLGVLLLPMAYTYFAIQVGSKWNNAAIYAAILVSVLVFIPNLTIFLGEPSLNDDVTLRMNRLHIIKDGALYYIIDLSDMVVIIQALVISARIIVFNRTIHKLELVFSKELRVFFAYAVACIVFAIATYIIPWDFWMANPYLFMAGFALVTTAEYIQIAKNRDISALVTKETAEPVKLDEYIKFNNDLASRARSILDGEKRYLLPGLVIDDMVNELGTNRTYFTRMMRIEFGQSFTEYVNNQRLKYSQELLRNTDKTINEIAEESGFGSASTYCRVFKRITDTTPEAWREAFKK